METVKGYVEHIVYRNEGNGYTVFNLNNDDGDLTCVGKFHFIEEGELLELSGGYAMHKLYGTQFQVEEAKACKAEDLVSIERYLGSGAIKGIGAALAGRIVKKFREDTFRIIEEEPERLAEIKGISERMAREISVQVEEKRDGKPCFFCINMGYPRPLRRRYTSITGRAFTVSLRRILISLQTIYQESVSRPLMRLRRRSEFVRIPITASAAVFSIPSCRA